MAMWTIDYRGRARATTTQHGAEADTLAVFFATCDSGSPGRYTLRSSQNAVLATGDVKAQEMKLKWYRDRIMYALGSAAAADEVDKAAKCLDEVDK